ncbi:MAG: hypothetical protein HQK53_02515 [Oligoflexia bacterium]|nr:hypothetical protein [Oligoflexia bacterium]
MIRIRKYLEMTNNGIAILQVLGVASIMSGLVYLSLASSDKLRQLQFVLNQDQVFHAWQNQVKIALENPIICAANFAGTPVATALPTPFNVAQDSSHTLLSLFPNSDSSARYNGVYLSNVFSTPTASVSDFKGYRKAQVTVRPVFSKLTSANSWISFTSARFDINLIAYLDPANNYSLRYCFGQSSSMETISMNCFYSGGRFKYDQNYNLTSCMFDFVLQTTPIPAVTAVSTALPSPTPYSIGGKIIALQTKKDTLNKNITDINANNGLLKKGICAVACNPAVRTTISSANHNYITALCPEFPASCPY